MNRLGVLGLGVRYERVRTCPRMPETVRIEAPSNLATSRAELNMPETKAVFLWTWGGVRVEVRVEVRAESRVEVRATR